MDKVKYIRHTFTHQWLNLWEHLAFSISPKDTSYCLQPQVKVIDPSSLRRYSASGLSSHAVMSSCSHLMKVNTESEQIVLLSIILVFKLDSTSCNSDKGIPSLRQKPRSDPGSRWAAICLDPLASRGKQCKRWRQRTGYEARGETIKIMMMIIIIFIIIIITTTN